MNKTFSYSVAIRTLGTAGEKYKKLLDSIQNQTVRPEKIVVVLPEGYRLPEYQIGTEEFVFCQKGMITQRLKALEHITSEYVLFCDDDVEPEPEFVEKVSHPLINGAFACSSAPLLEFLPPAGVKYIFASLAGGACVMLHGRKNNFVRVLSTGGYSYNRSISLSGNKLYYAESLPWTCFLISAKALQNIHFEDELWAGHNGYAAFDDQMMFYKLIINGYKVCVVSNARYKHNDEKTSIKGLKLEPAYATAFNHYVFWHRFLYTPCTSVTRKIWLKICISYCICMRYIYSLLLQAAGRETKEMRKIKRKGFGDAKKFVKSQEYQCIPKAIVDIKS